MKKISCFLLISISLFFSCKKDVNELNNESNATVKRSVQSTRTDVTSTFTDLLDVPVNIIVKENNVGNFYLTGNLTAFNSTSNYINSYVADPPSFSPKSGSPLQTFYLQRSTIDSNTILISTHNTTTNKRRSIGAIIDRGAQPYGSSIIVSHNSVNPKWKIYSGGTIHDGSYIIENTYWGKVLGGFPHNGNVSIGQYQNLGSQEFEIRAEDDFQLIDIEYINDASATISQQPDFVTQWFYSNNTSIQQSMSTSFTGRASYTSSFSKTSGGTVSVSGSVTVGIPGTVSGTINTSVSANYSATYGGSETKEDAQTYNFPINVAPRTSVTAAATVGRYLINLKYKARMRGINTGKLITVSGIWEGIACTDVKVALVEKSLDTGETLRSTTLSKIPKTTFKFN